MSVMSLSISAVPAIAGAAFADLAAAGWKPRKVPGQGGGEDRPDETPAPPQR